MKKVYVAVGSTRKPKLDGVREAISEIGPMLDPDALFELVAADVPSGVGHTPSSREESMAGARNRAEALRKLAQERSEPWTYFVGLEGGLDVIAAQGRRIVFLESWAYVLDRSGVGSFGRSGGIEMPEVLSAEVLENGVELGVAVDAFGGQRGIRDAQGAWGVLSRNMVTRQEAFRVAVTAAFARFFNVAAYSAK